MGRRSGASGAGRRRALTARAIERFLRTALENRRNVVRDALARARHVPAGSPRDVVLADILPAGGHETAGAVLLVTLGPNLVRSTHLAQAPRTPDEACDLIGAAVERVVAGAGENSQLAVRHVRTAQALRTRFPDCDVVATTELPALDAFAGAGGASPGARRAFVGADQRLAAPLRDDLVAAALACFRDHPWRWAEPAQLVHAQGRGPLSPRAHRGGSVSEAAPALYRRSHSPRTAPIWTPSSRVVPPMPSRPS